MERQDKYSLTYPTSLTNAIRMVVTQKGDLFQDNNGEVLEVKQVIQPPMGALPELILESKSS